MASTWRNEVSKLSYCVVIGYDIKVGVILLSVAAMDVS